MGRISLCVPLSDASQTPATSLVPVRSPGETDLWSNPTQQSFYDHFVCEDLAGLSTVHADFATALAMQAVVQNQFIRP